MAKAGKIRIKVDDHATRVLKSVGLTLKSPEVTAEMQRGAEIMANAARQRAPVRTGALKKGVYTASQLRLEATGRRLYDSAALGWRT